LNCKNIFLPIPIIISSNKGKALLTISTWPIVIGSKVPGKTALLIIRVWANVNEIQELETEIYHSY
jgi:hypothetical protein